MEEIDRYYNFSSMLIYPIFLFLYDFFIDIFIIPFGGFYSKIRLILDKLKIRICLLFDIQTSI